MVIITSIDYQSSPDTPAPVGRLLPMVSSIAFLGLAHCQYDSFKDANDAVYAAVDVVINRLYPSAADKIRATVIFSPLYKVGSYNE